MEGTLSFDSHSWWLASQWHSGGTITSHIYFSCPPYAYPLSQVLCSPLQLIHLHFWNKSSLNHNHVSSFYMLCSFLPSPPPPFPSPHSASPPSFLEQIFIASQFHGHSWSVSPHLHSFFFFIVSLSFPNLESSQWMSSSRCDKPACRTGQSCFWAWILDLH